MVNLKGLSCRSSNEFICVLVWFFFIIFNKRAEPLYVITQFIKTFINLEVYKEIIPLTSFLRFEKYFRGLS